VIVGSFKIRIGDEIITHTNYNDIPEKFDNLIEFIPTFPEGPHTEEEHHGMSIYTELLQELMKRETNASGN
jgi:hypothetical protein